MLDSYKLWRKSSNFAALSQITMKKIEKTNAARLLDAASIAYELIPYEVDESDLGAQHIADQLGENIEQVFKTLVLQGDKTGYLVCVIPGAEEVDLIPMKELLPLTGYIRGGCSPVGMKKPFPTYIDEACILYDYIYVSAGVRGLQFKIDPQALVAFVGAETVDLIAQKTE